MGYSQLSQDIFVLNFFDNQPGFYLELGCNDGTRNTNSNCLLLEENGWDGIGVDIGNIDVFNSHRKGRGIQADLTKIKIQDILDECKAPEIIDYFSYDVDDALKPSLESLSLEKYKFSLIHFEHNEYLASDPLYTGLKQAGREKFLNAGYELLVDNLLYINNGAVEDWYIHPDLIDQHKKILLQDIYHADILSAYGYR